MRYDCHMHMVLDGVEWKSAIRRHSEKIQENWIRQQLNIYRELGFGYLRDGGDRWGVGAKARELAKEYGIIYRTPLANLCKKGHYGGFIGATYGDFREYRALVRKAREDGADFIKIMISGLMDFDRFGVLTEDGLPAEEIRELIHIAHEEGFSVMAHANGAYLDEDALWAMKEAGTVWVPTLSTVGNLRGTGRFSERDVQEILESALANVRKFAGMGGLLAPGTDAGAWAVPHGSLTEFELMADALGKDADGILEKGIREIVRKF